MLRNTEVYGLQHRIDMAVQAQLTFLTFRDSIRDRFAEAFPESDTPPERVLRFLYERAVEGKADRLWLRKLREIRGSNEWKAHKAWLRRAIQHTRELSRTLRDGDSRPTSVDDIRKVRSVAQSTAGLLRRLLEIQKWDERLSENAKISYRNSTLKQLRFASDRILRTHCSVLNKTQRAELIALVVETAGLKTEEMPETIARQFRRAQETPKFSARKRRNSKKAS
jgi:hypothetical protein